jgi:hypothetical protein
MLFLYPRTEKEAEAMAYANWQLPPALAGAPRIEPWMGQRDLATTIPPTVSNLNEEYLVGPLTAVAHMWPKEVPVSQVHTWMYIYSVAHTSVLALSGHGGQQCAPAVDARRGRQAVRHGTLLTRYVMTAVTATCNTYVCPQQTALNRRRTGVRRRASRSASAGTWM